MGIGEELVDEMLKGKLFRGMGVGGVGVMRIEGGDEGGVEKGDKGNRGGV